MKKRNTSKITRMKNKEKIWILRNKGEEEDDKESEELDKEEKEGTSN